jgi:hypothetical protein
VYEVTEVSLNAAARQPETTARLGAKAQASGDLGILMTRNFGLTRPHHEDLVVAWSGLTPAV